jgi:hypothetical protein
MKEIFFALLVLFGGVVLLVEANNDRRDQASVKTNGIDVISEPLEGYTIRKKAGVAIGYDLRANFKTTTGASHTCFGSVQKDTIDRLEGAPTIKVRYLAQDPDICSLEGEEKGSFWFVTLISLGLIIGSIAYIYNRMTVAR